MPVRSKDLLSFRELSCSIENLEKEFNALCKSVTALKIERDFHKREAKLLREALTLIKSKLKS